MVLPPRRALIDQALVADAFAYPLLAPGQSGVPPCGTSTGGVTGICDTQESSFASGYRTIFRSAFQMGLKMADYMVNETGFASDLGFEVRREAVGQVVDAGLTKLLERLRKYPGAAELKPPLAPQSPVLPITFRRADERFLTSR